jgi:acyl carrier protein
MDDVRSAIRSFLGQFLEQSQLADDQDMFAGGFFNSLFMMQLVLFVEQEFSITIEDEDLEIENFSTIRALAALIERKRAPAASSRCSA